MSTEKGEKLFILFPRVRNFSMMFLAVSFSFEFCFFASLNLLASFLNHIDDTDETYGYYEPTHYLLFGTGMQTWEYAPLFAIRTYAFLAPFAMYSWAVINSIGFTKVYLFFVIRGMLGFFSALAQAKMVCSVRQRFGIESSKVFTTLMALSPGIFFSCTAYLPSAVSMTLAMFACSAWLSGFNLKAIIFGSIAVLCTGWPFVGLILGCLGIEMILGIVQSSSSFKQGLLSIISLVSQGFCVVAVLVALSTAIDRYFYGKWTSPTLNILLYNAISSEHGDELYGVEPASYYIKNLFLNTGLSFILATMAPLIYAVKWLALDRLCVEPDPLRLRSVTQFQLNKLVTLHLMLYVWVLVLLLRPHKEERFMYPIFPLMAFVASHSFLSAVQVVKAVFDSVVSKVFNLSHYEQGKWSDAMVRSINIILRKVAAMLFISRIIALRLNYQGYIGLWKNVSDHLTAAERSSLWQATSTGTEYQTPTFSVCTGSEWYQFPSHFFLPPSAKLAFIDDDFKGILPQHFPNLNESFGLYHHMGTSSTPALPVNNLNKEEVSRYVPLSQCDYLVTTFDPYDEKHLYYSSNAFHRSIYSKLPSEVALHSVVTDIVELRDKKENDPNKREKASSLLSWFVRSSDGSATMLSNYSFKPIAHQKVLSTAKKDLSPWLRAYYIPYFSDKRAFKYYVFAKRETL